MASDTTKILPHTADLAIKITSETLPGLFRLSLQSLNQLLKPNFHPRIIDLSVTERVKLQSPDTTALLIDFLSKVLRLSQIHKAIFVDFDIDKMTDCELVATLSGKQIGAFAEDVKTVTYHEAEVTVNGNGDWETSIIFDV